MEADPLKTSATGWLAGELGKPSQTTMAEYRAFTLGHDGHITASRAFVCANDEDATVWAKQLVDGHAIELWSGERFVIKLEHQYEERPPQEPPPQSER
jgi:hypothetical protein